jgi:pimeloyl-ACP methyl ester carboxylesterase
VPQIDIGAQTVHFREAGTGRPIVLLHGIGSNSASWRHQLAGLSALGRVIAWDAPGYGASTVMGGTGSAEALAEALRSFLAALQLGDVLLVGHSLGGVIAAELFRNGPGPVTRLVLADTTRGGATGDPAHAQERLATRLAWIGRQTAGEMAAERAPQLLSPAAPAEAVREATARMSEVRPEGYTFAAEALAGADTIGALRTIRVPTLLIWGADDRITPLDEGYRIRELIPHCRMEVISNAGHLCYLEDRARFNTLVGQLA